MKILLEPNFQSMEGMILPVNRWGYQWGQDLPTYLITHQGSDYLTQATAWAKQLPGNCSQGATTVVDGSLGKLVVVLDEQTTDLANIIVRAALAASGQVLTLRLRLTKDYIASLTRYPGAAPVEGCIKDTLDGLARLQRLKTLAIQEACVVWDNSHIRNRFVREAKKAGIEVLAR